MSECKKAIPCEIYSRVAGYLRPTACWNIGKKQEFRERNYYDKKLIEAIRNEN